jgi:hypothetical protein
MDDSDRDELKQLRALKRMNNEGDL